MQELDLILTLAAGFIAALLFGYATQRLGWSPMVGYLLAGVLVGPHTPGFVADKHLADQLAEVGVILLMFGVGLHFHLKDLLAVRRIAVIGALVQSAIATLLGALAVRSLGWTWSSGIVFGMALSVASTVVLIRVLSDNREIKSPTGRIAVGWLVMEDILTVFILVLLPVVFTAASGSNAANVPLELGKAALKLGAFIAFTLFAGGRFIPRLLDKVAQTRSGELFTLSVLAVALGIAVAATYFFGISMALGAFLAGMVVGQSDFSSRAAADALPMRDAFAVMFFLSVGMLFDPPQALQSPLPILLTLAIVLIGKPVAALSIAALLGYSSRVAMGVAIALAQIGEFSFLLAAVGRQVGVLPEAAMNPLVATAILSIMANPLLFRSVDGMERAVRKVPWLWRIFNRGAARAYGDEIAISAPRSAVVVGYGPVGRLVARLLGERGIEPVIVEMNLATYRQLRSEGHLAVYGDANQRPVLEQAGIANAAGLVLSASGSAEALESIRAAREINPEIHVVARADYLRQSDSLRAAGADEVFTGEGEVALAMTGSILERLGATPEQLDKERERIRTELINPGTP